MEKIMIIGCPGSGKSTFARELRDKTGLPLYYLDTIWHRPDKTTVSKEEFDRRLTEITETDRWIIDGNYNRTIEVRLRKCDTVFLLDYPLEVCLAGARERVGKPHEDLPWLEETFDEEFRIFIERFEEDSMPKIRALLDKYRDRNIVVFRSREESRAYLEAFGDAR